MTDPPPPLDLPRRPRWGDELEVEVVALTPQGLGRGRIDTRLGPAGEPRSFAVFVRQAVPGDRVRVAVEQARRGRLTGRCAEILRPSPDRVAPRCPHFGDRRLAGTGCGGCALQSLGYQAQLDAKAALVRTLLGAADVDPGLVRPPLGMATPWHYRNKMELSFGDDGQRRFALGMHPAGYKHEILRLETCFLQSEGMAALVPAVRAWAEAHELEPYKPRDDAGFLRTLTVREGKRTGERMLELTTTGAATARMDGRDVPAEAVAESFAARVAELVGELGVAVTSVYWTRQHAAKGEATRLEERLLAGRPVLREELCLAGQAPLRFEIHPRAFFQPNTLQAEVLYGQVAVAAGLGDGGRLGHALDLYCGTGTIGLTLAARADWVTGVELRADAVEDARRNAALGGLANVAFHAGDVGEVLASQDVAARGPIDLVIVDPPRCGLLPAARERIAALAPSRLVYVSCNPAALADDLATLGRAGWATAWVQPVDMFPHTAHIECVVALRRADAT